jgi:hypothetical protein
MNNLVSNGECCFANDHLINETLNCLIHFLDLDIEVVCHLLESGFVDSDYDAM